MEYVRDKRIAHLEDILVGENDYLGFKAYNEFGKDVLDFYKDAINCGLFNITGLKRVGLLCFDTILKWVYKNFEEKDRKKYN
ncbi:MAG: hypothetical protein ACTSQJ_19370 [Promethearchaeota archaeon]